MACNIHNAYLAAEFIKRVWVVAGPEFGLEAGQCMAFKKSLYELKRYGASFRAQLVETLYSIGYKPSYAFPDVRIRSAVYRTYRFTWIS